MNDSWARATLLNEYLYKYRDFTKFPNDVSNVQNKQSIKGANISTPQADSVHDNFIANREYGVLIIILKCCLGIYEVYYNGYYYYLKLIHNFHLEMTGTTLFYNSTSP